MAIPSPGYSITVRVEVPAAANATAALTAAVASAGGALTALDVAESRTDRLVVDVTCDTTDEAHADTITDAIAAIPGVEVRKVSDRTFLLHLGGKIEVNPKVPLKHRDDLSRAYTPGVARVCLAIAENPEDARRLTIKRNTVAVVTDGSAVLGLGNIGPLAALPVMEGKAALFKQFAGVDAWPVCLDTQDTDEIVAIVKAIAPGLRRHQPRGHLGAKLLRDRGAAARPARHPRLPRRPARHGDRRPRRPDERAARRRQAHRGRPHRRLRRRRSRARHHPAPARRRAPRDIVGCGRTGALHPAQTAMDPSASGSPTTPTPAPERHPQGGPRRRRRLHRRLGARPAHRRRHRDDGAGRDRLRPRQPGSPRSTRSRPASTRRSWRPVAPTTRTRSTTSSSSPASSAACSTPASRDITDAMMVAAASAIADCVDPGELNASFIVPSVFDASVAPAVAAAVLRVAGPARL